MRGSKLILRRGAASEVLDELIEDTGAAAIFWNRRYEPASAEHDAALERDLEAARHRRRELQRRPAVRAGGDPHRVGHAVQGVHPVLARLPGARCCRRAARDSRRSPLLGTGHRATISTAGALLPTKPDWADGLREAWTPGEAEAPQAPVGLPAVRPRRDPAT